MTTALQEGRLRPVTRATTRRRVLTGIVAGTVGGLLLVRAIPAHAERRANPALGETPANPPGNNGQAPPVVPPGNFKRSEKSQGRFLNDTGPG